MPLQPDEMSTLRLVGAILFALAMGMWIGWALARSGRHERERAIRWNAESDGMRTARALADEGKPIVPRPYMGDWPMHWTDPEFGLTWAERMAVGRLRQESRFRAACAAERRRGVGGYQPDGPSGPAAPPPKVL